jgi:hypothetical protein
VVLGQNPGLDLKRTVSQRRGALHSLMHPLSVAILLLAAGLLLWKRGAWARTLCGAALLLLVAFGSPVVASALLRSLEGQYPDSPIETLPPSTGHRSAGRIGADPELAAQV